MAGTKSVEKVTRKADLVSTEVPPRLSVNDLADIASFEDAFKIAAQRSAGELLSAADLGDGFVLLRDHGGKDKLVGKEFVVLTIQFGTSDKYRNHDGEPQEFVAMRCVDRTGGKWILVDGSTGIYEQMRGFSPENFAGMYVPKGLRKSEYDTTDEIGNEIVATTYYLDTAPA